MFRCHSTTLNSIEHIRCRPSKYLHRWDSVDRLHNMVFEIVEHSVYEVFTGHVESISVTIHKDGSVSVQDDGQGISVGVHEELSNDFGRDCSILEGIMTVPGFASSLQENQFATLGPKIDCCQAAVNSCSLWCHVQVQQDGKVYSQSYQRGIPDGPVKNVEAASTTGKITTFLPDDQILGDIRFDYTKIRKRLQRIAQRHSGLHVSCVDDRSDERDEFCYVNGPADLVTEMMLDRDPVTPNVIHTRGDEAGVDFEVAFQFSKQYQRIAAYVNNRPMRCESIICDAIACVLSKVRATAELPPHPTPNKVDYYAGVQLVISARIKAAKNEPGTNRLLARTAESIGNTFEQFFEQYMKDNPSQAQAILTQVVERTTAPKWQSMSSINPPQRSQPRSQPNLSDREHVRTRAGMYIGDTTDRGLHHLVYELVANSIQEAEAGFADSIQVSIHSDGSLTVEDNGRGIPTDIDPELSDRAGREMSILEGVMTELQYSLSERPRFQINGGLHGVGVTVVNFLSESCQVEVFRGGQSHEQHYRNGVAQGGVLEKGPTTRTGTKTTMRPDPSIFQTTTFDYELLEKRLRQLAYLNSKVAINLTDKRSSQSETFHYPNGIETMLTHSTPIRKDIDATVFRSTGNSEGIDFDIAMKYCGSAPPPSSFVNNILCREGGTQVRGFHVAVAHILNRFATETNLVSKTRATMDDFRKTFAAAISLRHPAPQWEGSTKTKIANSEVEGVVNRAVREMLGKYLKTYPEIGRRAIADVASANELTE